MLRFLRHGTRRHPVTIRGFTLQEVLVSLLIGGTLITGGSNLWGAVQESARTTTVNALVAHLNLARSEALKRHARISMCASKDQSTCTGSVAEYTFWHDGWLVYVDRNENGKLEADEILRVHAALTRDLIVRTSAARHQVTYQPTGLAGGSTITFALCDARGAKFARYVIVSNSGRARVARKSDSTVRC